MMIDREAGRGTLLGLALILSGCAAAPGEPPVAAAPAQVRTLRSSAGLEGVMGRTAGVLVSQFGKADLDVREGSARKLQFAGPVCVLDTYLYAPEGGGEPIVTYIDARSPDGGDFDRASCVAALQAAHR